MISPWQLLIVLLVVLLIFGTKRLRGAGRDLGEAIKGFKKGMGEDEQAPRQLEDQPRTADDAASTPQAQPQPRDETPPPR